MELDAIDKALLEVLQSSFPLLVRPFYELGNGIGVNENEVLLRVRRLRSQDIIRQISAIFDTRKLGYQSTLVAFHVKDEELESVAVQVSAHPGVSHNYARPHHYNMWFTLAVPPGKDLTAEIIHLAKKAQVSDWLNLPATRMFKLRTHFKLGNSVNPTHNATISMDREKPKERAIIPADIPIIQQLQQDLPLITYPFAEWAVDLNLSQEALIKKAQELINAGIMRRFGAVLRHRKAGYKANGMACWIVPDAHIEKAGLYAAGFPQVSHCYQRPAYPPRWPYTLFTMVHGQTKEQVETVVAQISQETGLDEYEILYSTKEFKKERVRYFAERS
ncbi:MAG: Lrp/AsnC family transcriptional regulator [Anaerolineae bacterium]|nr:Lrp/AsnC family transcriptional regulator [Anaerolineae bacterium]